MTVPTGGSVMPAGATPVIHLPPQKARVNDQYTLADIDPVGRSEFLFYGPPGSGKTVCAATAEPPFRWVDADGGLKSIRWAFAEKRTALTKLEDLVAFRPKEDESYPQNPKALDEMADMIAFWFSPGEVDKWKTLVLDSGTEISLWAQYKGLHLNGMLPKRDKPLSVSDQVNELAKTLILQGKQDYKSAEGLFMGLLTDIRVDCAKFNKNLILICHEWIETDEEGAVIRYLPALIGQLRTRIAKDFDDVWHFQMYTTTTGKEVKVNPHGDQKHIGKTRWGQVLAKEEVPDLRQIVAKVKKFHGIT